VWAPLLKTGEGLRPPWVRIPVPPPYSEKALSFYLALFCYIKIMPNNRINTSPKCAMV